MNDADLYLNEISMKFLRAVRAKFGKETGVDAIQALSPILGKAWMGQLIYDMMADNHKTSQALSITIDSACHQKINVIKAVRTADYSLGLKEAKDLVEANIGTGPFILNVSAGHFTNDGSKDMETHIRECAQRAYNDFNSIVGCRAEYV